VDFELHVDIANDRFAHAIGYFGSAHDSFCFLWSNGSPHRMTEVNARARVVSTTYDRSEVGHAYHRTSTIDRVELRQLTYFVAVAEELHFGRAAARLHIAGPSLSQQISTLERELGTQLLVRDRRHVELTPAGRRFLTDAREVLAAAARAVDRTREGGGELPLRLGYVSWLPPEAAALRDPRVRVDEWVLPSHTQVARVAEGSLDLAIAWIEEADVERLDLAAHLLWYESLEAVVPRAHQATRHESVRASEITVLVDVDEASWLSWNRYASAFATASRASVKKIEDGGIAGPAFFDHVARLRRPVLESPKRHSAPMPPTLTRRPVRSPVPVWPWALIHRADDTRPMVARATRVLIDHASNQGWRAPPSEPYWLPANASPGGGDATRSGCERA
jgi:DNA-binding transcriptional LysR family regulator